MTATRLKLAIISTHPIQYYSPLFRSLAGRSGLSPRVFYTWSQTQDAPVHDAGFGRTFSWDVPLLDGHDHEFVPNVAAVPGTHHFNGIDNPDLIGRIESWGADAVLVFGWNLRSHLAAMRHFKGRRPVFFRGDSTLLDPQPTLRRLARRAWLRWVYRHVDVALAVGANNVDYYSWCGLPAARIALVPHAIDTERFGDRRHDGPARAIRAELGIPDSSPTLVYAGKFLPKKDPLLLLDAFFDAGAGCHLVLFGDGPLGDELRRRSLHRPNLRVLPFQNQSAMPVVYRVGDAVVLPSCGPGETWGLALNEAMASGRPVIASSRVGAARDLVVEARSGWTFEAGQRMQLARAIVQFRDAGPRQIAAMGEYARAHSQRWSIGVAAAALERAVLAHCGRAAPDGVALTA